MIPQDQAFFVERLGNQVRVAFSARTPQEVVWRALIGARDAFGVANVEVKVHPLYLHLSEQWFFVLKATDNPEDLRKACEFSCRDAVRRVA